MSPLNIPEKMDLTYNTVVELKKLELATMKFYYTAGVQILCVFLVFCLLALFIKKGFESENR